MSPIRSAGGRTVAAMVIALVLAAGGGVAVGAVTASSKPKAVKVCVTKKGLVRAASAHNKCPKRTHKVKVGTKGPRGATGVVGPKGDKGDAGPGAQGFEKRLAVGDPTYRVPGTEIDANCFAGGHPLSLSTEPTDGNFVGIHGNESTIGVVRSYFDQVSGGDNTSINSASRVMLDGIFTPTASPSATVHEQVDMIWLPDSQVCEVFGQVTPAS